MGYACPVCADPQADRGHLANHLAFTAMLGDEAHEAWLEDHAPGWGEMGESDLADAVVEDVEETQFPQVFEDTAGGLEDPDGPETGDPPSERSGALFDDEPGHGHGHEHGPGRDGSAGPGHGHGPGSGHEHEPASGKPLGGGDRPLDEDAEAILEEAREMTRRMIEDEGTDADEDGGADASDGGAASGNDGTGGGATTDADADADVDNNE